MGIFNFSVPKPRQYNYQPRYYDERKERLNNMIAAAKAEKEGRSNGEVYHSLQPGFLRTYHNRSKRITRAKRSSNTRLLVIMAFLTCLMYIYTGNKSVVYIMFGVMCVITLGSITHRR